MPGISEMEQQCLQNEYKFYIFKKYPSTFFVTGNFRLKKQGDLMKYSRYKEKKKKKIYNLF